MNAPWPPEVLAEVNAAIEARNLDRAEDAIIAAGRYSDDLPRDIQKRLYALMDGIVDKADADFDEYDDLD
jgi:hypothetical protein